MTKYAGLADRLEAALGVTEAVGIVITSGDAEGPSADTAEASCAHWSGVLTSGRARRTTASDHAGLQRQQLRPWDVDPRAGRYR